jgi:hypothetical protein
MISTARHGDRKDAPALGLGRPDMVDDESYSSSFSSISSVVSPVRSLMRPTSSS